VTTAEAVISRKIEEVRAEYEARGCDVAVGPGPEHVPFDLGGLHPDLLVRCGADRWLVFVRLSGMWVSMQHLLRIAHEMQQDPTWHLLLVTADDVELAGAPGLDDALPSWTRLRADAARALGMARAGADPDAAFFILWATVEAVLRKTAECEGVPVERLPTADMLAGAYTFGSLSLERYDRLRVALTLRNRVAHGFGVPRVELEQAVETLAETLVELLPQPAGRAA
jgi:hypothetical protein